MPAEIATRSIALAMRRVGRLRIRSSGAYSTHGTVL